MTVAGDYAKVVFFLYDGEFHEAQMVCWLVGDGGVGYIQLQRCRYAKRGEARRDETD